MKQEINNYSDLRAEIERLKEVRSVQEVQIGEKFNQVSEALRPSNLLKDSLSDVVNAGKKDRKLFPLILGGVLELVLHSTVHKEAPLERWLKDLGINATGSIVEKITGFAQGAVGQKFRDIFRKSKEKGSD